MDPLDEFLMHYGVAGMRWGKRRSQAGTTHISKRARQATKAHKPMSSKLKKDLAVTLGLGAAMVATMALGEVSAAQTRAYDRKLKTQFRTDFSDSMGLPMHSIKLTYNSSSNIWS